MPCCRRSIRDVGKHIRVMCTCMQVFIHVFIHSINHVKTHRNMCVCVCDGITMVAVCLEKEKSSCTTSTSLVYHLSYKIVDASSFGTAILAAPLRFFFFGLFLHINTMVTRAINTLQPMAIHAIPYAPRLAFVPGNPASVA